MNDAPRFLREHQALTRRFFLAAGAASLGWAAVPSRRVVFGAEPDARLAEAVNKLEPFFTPPAEFRDVSRGKPIPHTLTEERRREVGLTRETWRLEVVADSEQPAKIRRPLSREKNTALDFAALLQIAETKAVRFAKVMTCLNMGCPLGMGVWEGVPLRDVLWLTQPVENLRRVFYYGYHNDDPKQIFRSSLPAGRVLEDPYELPPVILCYKLNGQWLSPQRGGPVRMVVPEAYGFKSVKWLTHVVLTNQPHSNDTYADGNNDIDSPLKSFAATLSVPSEWPAGQPLPVTGYAQVGLSGVRGVQTLVTPADEEPAADDPYFQSAKWTDARLLGPPSGWGGELPEDRIPEQTLGFDGQKPRQWPLPLGKVHWAALLPPLPAGEYALRSRTIDDKGIAQPMPRPFRKSGHSGLETVNFKIIEPK